MNLTDVMEEVAARLATIKGMRVFPYPADSVSPPAAIVSYPETLTYDETYGRGSDRMALPVVVVVGKPYDRSTRDLITRYTDGSGASSVKAALETGTYASCDGVRVTRAEFDVVSIAGTDYVAAQFDLDIAGSGS